MKRLPAIPILRATNGEVWPANPLRRVVLSSARSNWSNLVVEEYRFSCSELDNVMYTQHVIAVNLGRPLTYEYKKHGRFRKRVFKSGTISFSPSHHPFFSRLKEDEEESAAALVVALDPVFVSQTAAEMEVYPDRVELAEQRGAVDPTLRHMAMALRHGLQSGCAGDALYGEALSTALAVHLLRQHCGIAVRPQPASGRLPREKLMRAFEFIQDQLEANLTVAGIARAVHMSPYHFSRLFKKSTGQPPYRYVIQARVKKAKELLTSGKLPIIEIAHRLGFADQSHLTRHLKQAFGITPKMLQETRSVEQDSSKDPQKHSREPLA
jgi:AraC family transcriptional regulator